MRIKETVKHLGIIMDGNRRWASERKLRPFEGHRAGSEKTREVIRWCAARKIKFLSIYAFSTENWRRPGREVRYLMSLLRETLQDNIEEFCKDKGRIRFVGSRRGLPSGLITVMEEAEAMTRRNNGIIVNVLLNYGGRAEITEACRKLVEGGAKPERISERNIAKLLHTSGMPDPDLVIRTGGEQRLSNFLIWQTAYSELYFCKRYWPDFSEKDLDEALADYASRQRRLGK